MRVVIDLTALAFNFSGIEQYAFRITRELVRQNDDTQYTLVFLNEPFSGLEDVLDLPCVDCHIMRPRHAGKLPATQLSLPRELRDIDADVYLFPAFPQPVAFKDDRSISVIHDVGFWDCPETFTRRSLIYWRTAARNAVKNTPVVTVSNFSKRRIVEVMDVDPQNVEVVYNGIDPIFCAARTLKSDAFYHQILETYQVPKQFILSLCTLEPRKNLSLLIKAWVLANTWDNSIPDLVLAGRSGWKIDQLLADVPPHLLPHIHLTGFIEQEDLPHLYHLCDRFVCPSLYEGFGLPPLEALAAGATVLCSDIEVFHETCNGLVSYFDPNNPKDLAQLLSQELKSAPGNQVDLLCQRFSWNTSARTLHGILCKKARQYS